MKRRNFIQNSTLTDASLMAVNPLFSNNSLKPSHIYNLNYAPHLGMFKHHEIVLIGGLFSSICLI